MLSRIWLSLLVVTGACAGEPSPVEKCDTLVDELCDRALECIPNAGTHSQCIQELQQVIPCGGVKAVSASYDRCMDQLESFSCAVLFPVDQQTRMQTLELPADCMSVVLSRTTEGS
jgi:hypothetical protein